MNCAKCKQPITDARCACFWGPTIIPMTTCDFSVSNEGSLYLLTAHTPEAQEWVEEHLPSDRQTWGQSSTVVEHRFILDIATGIKNDGLSISES